MIAEEFIKQGGVWANEEASGRSQDVPGWYGIIYYIASIHVLPSNPLLVSIYVLPSNLSQCYSINGVL